MPREPSSVCAQTPGPAPKYATLIDHGTATVCAALPFTLAVAHAADSSQWRDDLATVRATTLLATPTANLFSTLIHQLFSCLPIGALAFRGALASAVLAGLAGFLMHRLTTCVLRRLHEAPRLAPIVASSAALAATLSPLVQREATVAGGSLVAVDLALLALWVVAAFRPSDARGDVAVGALLAATAMESPATAAVLGVALGVALVARGGITKGGLGRAAVGLVAAAALFALPLLLRQVSTRSFVDVGLATRVRDMIPLDVATLRARGISTWLADVGVAALLLTLLGTVAGLVRPWGRSLALPLVVLLLTDLLVPARSAGILTPDVLAGVRSLAVASSAVLAAMGVHTLVVWLASSRIAFARPASVLVVAFHLCLAAVSGEEASFRADRTTSRGADSWTSAAVETLPPFSILLVRSEPVALRLWAARLAAGTRPDITVVPLPLLGRGAMAMSLLAEEPALAPLLRDMSSSSQPSEYGLSSIADVRPLFVELDPAWDRRLATHVMPDHLWLRFHPQPLGSSDRWLSQTDETAARRSVLAAAITDTVVDEATLEILASHTREQLVASALVGDREARDRALGYLVAERREPKPGDAVWAYIDPPKKTEARRPRRLGTVCDSVLHCRYSEVVPRCHFQLD